MNLLYFVCHCEPFHSWAHATFGFGVFWKAWSTGGELVSKTQITFSYREAYAQGKKERPPFVPREQSSSEDDADPIPDELLCPICNDLMTDAVVIPCCGNSYCDDCESLGSVGHPLVLCCYHLSCLVNIMRSVPFTYAASSAEPDRICSHEYQQEEKPCL